jgi:outer membrane biosynthesis protein TonB
MNETLPKDRKWYQKKRFIIPSLIATFFLANNQTSQTTNTNPIHIAPTSQNQVTLPTKQTQAITPTVKETSHEVPATQEAKDVKSNKTKPIPTKTTPSPSYEQKPTTPKEIPLSNNNHYTNTGGKEVHSPAYAPSVPQGASAICRDGTYSFSQSRRGTCSHHGGVLEWL